MSDQPRKREVGAVVDFVDAHAEPHRALVTAWWSDTCINVVFVSGDEAKRDDYGRQIERTTSLPHKNTNGMAHGMYWKWPDEELKPPQPPQAV